MKNRNSMSQPHTNGKQVSLPDEEALLESGPKKDFWGSRCVREDAIKRQRKTTK